MTTVGPSLGTIRVVRIEDGQIVPFEIRIQAAEAPNGRTRWLTDGRSIAFNWQAPQKPGIYAQEFRPGSDTAGSRHALVELEPGAVPESFGISPDGKKLTLSASYRNFSLMSADHVPDIVSPRRGGR